ncbi:MAG: serine/threonine protein kinase [Symploca sp. SIO2E6]|nr:serine/threonine protein kinase [Symploca sp. SIO2E6]
MRLQNRYEIKQSLGKGAFGETFLAWDHRDESYTTGRNCVVKKLSYQVDRDTLEIAIRLFKEEAKALKLLGSHPQIPELYDSFTQNQEFYLVQECIEGKDLRQELTDNSNPDSPQPRRLRATQTLRLLQEILEVLAFVHHRKIIHRDLKPENIMRRRVDGKLVLIDFGSVKKFTSVVERQGIGTVMAGTPGYMPDEQAAGQPRFASDVYAVGMIGLECLTGSNPLSFSKSYSTGQIEWPAEQLGLSKDFVAVLDKMIAPYFPHRYPSAVEALNALNRLSVRGGKQNLSPLGGGTPIGDFEFEETWVAPPPLPPKPTVWEHIFDWAKNQAIRLYYYLVRLLQKYRSYSFNQRPRTFKSNIRVIGPRPSGKRVFLATLAFYIENLSKIPVKNFGGRLLSGDSRKLLKEANYILAEGLLLEPTRVSDVDDLPIFCVGLRYLRTSIDLILRMYPGEIFDEPFFQSSQSSLWNEYLEDLLQSDSITVIIHPLSKFNNNDDSCSVFFESFYSALRCYEVQ